MRRLIEWRALQLAKRSTTSVGSEKLWLDRRIIPDVSIGPLDPSAPIGSLARIGERFGEA
jgi:hypothetical protein